MLFSVVAASPTGAADDEPVAPAGYQAKCTACHAAMLSGASDHLYRRHDRLVKHYSALQERVRYCSQGAKTGWDAAQLRKVVDYLNQRYYHFSTDNP